MSKYKHKDKNGTKTELKDLEYSHLNNIIAWIERKSNIGLIQSFGGGHDAGDMWYDENVIYGKKARKALNYKKYKKELLRRQLKKNTSSFLLLYKQIEENQWPNLIGRRFTTAQFADLSGLIMNKILSNLYNLDYTKACIDYYFDCITSRKQQQYFTKELQDEQE